MLLLLVLWTLSAPSCRLAIIGGKKNKNFLHETKNELCKVTLQPPLCTPVTDHCWARASLTDWRFCRKSVGSELQGKEILQLLYPPPAVNRGQPSRSQDRKRVHICRHNGNHMHEKDKFNFYLFSLFPLLCLTPITKRCAVCWRSRSAQGRGKCLG